MIQGSPPKGYYGLAKDEAEYLRSDSPPGLVPHALKKYLHIPDGLYGDDLYDFLKSCQVNGRPLYQIGFRELLHNTELTDGAVNAALDTIGFNCLGDGDLNSVDIIPEYLDFTPNARHFLIDAGFEQVPWALQEKFEERGGRVFQGHWLAGFERAALENGSTGVRLKFKDGHPDVTARAIVLAMPRLALELLRPDWPARDQAHFKEMLDRVKAIPLFKMFIRYPRAWWRDVGVCEGQSLTDKPLRQVWYWEPHGCKSGEGPALIMVYNDAASVDFWEKLRSSPSQQISQCNTGPTPKCIQERLSCNWREHIAPRSLLEEMQRQLVAMHGDPKNVPDPCDAAFMDWSDPPFGAGVHLWKAGYKSWEIVKLMARPVEDWPVFICGEAFSTHQTWVEGALETAELVLQRHFSLPVPDMCKC